MTEPPPMPPPLALCPDDVLLAIASHLPARDVRRLAAACRSIRSALVAGQSANAVLWAPRLAAAFPHVFRRAHGRDERCRSEDLAGVAFVDRRRRPARGPPADAHGDEVNLALLASLLPRRHPKGIDPGTLQCQAGDRRASLAGDQLMGAPFLGPVVGVGNHCVRSDEPFPAPCRAVSPSPSSATSMSGRISRWTKRRLGNLSRTKPCDNLRPFVAPTVVSGPASANGAEQRLLVDVTPRLVAYFEMTVAKQPQESSVASKGDRDSNQPHRLVAVGLSTESFRTQENLPGWDGASYGYHGDDGRFFRGGRAPPPTKLPPLFGPGDTVGCGLEYRARRIFFTLNGQFVQYAFGKVKTDDIEAGLYPTVGVDSDHPVCVNLGQRPFEFDAVRFAVDAMK
ncbi:hypothetical protein ACHAXT_010894 [Thalassiosira profunda]